MKSRYTIEFPSLWRVYKKTLSWPRYEWVTHKSPMPLKKSLHLCARYFLREGYSDFFCYDLDEKDFDAILFLNPERCEAIGACLFRKRIHKNDRVIWGMHWTWIHPFKRNESFLSGKIKLFNQRYGYWYPEYPHSKAMKAFVKKNNLIHPDIMFADSLENEN